MTDTRHHRIVLLLAALLLVWAQFVALTHTHEGDLAPQFDCELCHKLASGDDAIPVAVTVLALLRAIVQATGMVLHPTTRQVPVAVARAPPCLTA